MGASHEGLTAPPSPSWARMYPWTVRAFGLGRALRRRLSRKMATMPAHEIVAAYLDALQADPAWAATFCQSNALYTPLATAALVRAGFAEFPEAEHTAKQHPNRWGRCEYLTLDVVLCDLESWASPLFIAEHENSPSKSRIQYNAWKLLSVDAKRRVLVAYWGADKELPDFEALRSAVAEVAEDNPRRDIVLIAADYNAMPASATELRAGHRSVIVGRWET